jgi:hypothetical protein
VAGGTVITCWKSPFDPLAVANGVPFAERATVVLPAVSVHWVKPLPVMVTGSPAWILGTEGVSATTYTDPRSSRRYWVPAEHPASIGLRPTGLDGTTARAVKL